MTFQMTPTLDLCLRYMAEIEGLGAVPVRRQADDDLLMFANDLLEQLEDLRACASYLKDERKRNSVARSDAV